MAFCTNCGKELSDRAVACPQCGQPQATAAAWAHQAGAAVQGAATEVNVVLQRTDGHAIASLILGIVSFVIWPIGIVTSILAVLFGSKARKTIRQDPRIGGDGLAVAGIIIGWIWIGITSAVLVFIFTLSVRG